MKLNNIHNPSFETIVLKLCEEDTKKMIKQFGSQFFDSGCPVCSISKRHLQTTIWGLNYQRCAGCGLVYIAPCPTDEIRSWYLSNSEGLKFWRENMPKNTTSSRLEMHLDRAMFIKMALENHSVERKKTIVEVGAGNGELAKILSNESLFEEIILIEPQPLDVVLPSCKILQAELSEVNLIEPADVVLAFEVLEHINDPKAFLSDISKIISEDGLLIMSTPNVDGFEVNRLGNLSNAIMFDHVRLYSTESIRVLLEQEGWELLVVETPGMFDIDIICNHFNAGSTDLRSDPALRFICESDEQIRTEFQLFLQRELLSSHMKIVARKRKNL